MSAGRGRAIDAAWLEAHYPTMTDVHGLLDEHERDFGWRPRATSVYTKASRMGLRKAPERNRDGRAERRVRWSKEPELARWMLEHDRGQRTDELRAEFEAAWGFGLSRGQVNIFRASHGTQARSSHKGGRPRVPVGTERESKDGYIVVKVAEEATVPMSKDNWALKHVWAYEQAHGPVPEGCSVYFADGDRRNFDPANLVAVPKRLAGVLNNPETPEWHDRETLLACVALAEVKCALRDAEAASPRACGVCGRPFVPGPGRRHSPAKTCPDCLAAGHKASGERGRGRRYDHDEIRALAGAGLTRAEVARLVGYSPSTVSDVLNGRNHG